MRILITNDDGYKSPILPVLASWAKKHGEVTLVAPKSEQSGKSQSIDFRNAVEIKKVDIVEGVDCYYVDSTPADCVRFAVTGLKKEYDLVISGVNCGYNLGSDINYSGTIGAIMEGARCGFRGVAVSTDFDILMESEQYFDELFQYFTEKKLFKYNNLYNVNIPHKPVRGFRITKQGGIFYSDEFIHHGGDMYQQTGGPLNRPYDIYSDDIDTVMNGIISITPLTEIRTDLIAYEKLKNLK